MLATREAVTKASASASAPCLAACEWAAGPEQAHHYYRARHYDPKVGRFISEDPIEFEGGDSNLYTYVFNGPLALTDASGLATQRCTRPMKHIPRASHLPPHVLLGSTQAGLGGGLAPKEGAGVYFEVPGYIEWEYPYNPDGTVKPPYSCSTVSNSHCVERCVLRRLREDTTVPPNYKAGKYQCDMYAEDVLTVCERQCRGRQ